MCLLFFAAFFVDVFTLLLLLTTERRVLDALRFLDFGGFETRPPGGLFRLRRVNTMSPDPS